MGSSNAAHFRWLRKISRLSGLMCASSGERAEEVVGMLDDVLIERRARSDQNRKRGRLAAAGAAGALPSGSDGAGIAGENDRIERADIDTQFESIGRDDGANFAGSQTLLNVAALLRQIAAAIAAHRLVRERQLRTGIFEIGGQDFGGKPIVRENQRLLILADEFERDAARFVQITAADAQLRD